MKKRYIVSILSNMCQSRASNLKSGWKVVLSTLSAAVRAPYSLGRFFLVGASNIPNTCSLSVARAHRSAVKIHSAGETDLAKGACFLARKRSNFEGFILGFIRIRMSLRPKRGINNIF